MPILIDRALPLGRYACSVRPDPRMPNRPRFTRANYPRSRKHASPCQGPVLATAPRILRPPLRRPSPNQVRYRWKTPSRKSRLPIAIPSVNARNRIGPPVSSVPGGAPPGSAISPENPCEARKSANHRPILPAPPMISARLPVPWPVRRDAHACPSHEED